VRRVVAVLVAGVAAAIALCVLGLSLSLAG
jgi:hypothetical protein